MKEEAASLRRPLWLFHDDYLLVMLQIVCLLMFFYGVAVLSQNPEWFDGRRGQPPSVDHILAMWRRSHAKTADETILKQ